MTLYDKFFRFARIVGLLSYVVCSMMMLLLLPYITVLLLNRYICLFFQVHIQNNLTVADGHHIDRYMVLFFYDNEICCFAFCDFPFLS